MSSVQASMNSKEDTCAVKLSQLSSYWLASFHSSISALFWIKFFFCICILYQFFKISVIFLLVLISSNSSLFHHLTILVAVHPTKEILEFMLDHFFINTSMKTHLGINTFVGIKTFVGINTFVGITTFVDIKQNYWHQHTPLLSLLYSHHSPASCKLIPQLWVLKTLFN